jgi:hypothetical protein
MRRIEESDMYRASSVAAAAGVEGPQPRRLGGPAKGNADLASWYSKVATSWGAALDRQASRTVTMAQQLNNGNDGPGMALQVAAAAHQLTFLSTAASSVSNSIGEALQTLGRKQ